MQYDVNVTVTVCYTVTVQADTDDEAIDKAIDIVNSGKADCVPMRYVDAEVDCEYDEDEDEEEEDTYG